MGTQAKEGHTAMLSILQRIFRFLLIRVHLESVWPVDAIIGSYHNWNLADQAPGAVQI
jgi:hypothetical protein